MKITERAIAKYTENYNIKGGALLSGFRRSFRRGGIYYVFKIIFYTYVFPIYFRLFLTRRTFHFSGREFKYFFHPHNHTWANERAIEVPLILSYCEKVSDNDILEIGNVLSNYMPVRWAVLDKLEFGENILNADIADFRPKRKYGLIVSISTLEHVGYDEEERDDLKIQRAIANIRQNCLKENGTFMFTVPAGWNDNLDKMLLEGRIKCTETHYFRRVNWDNSWILASKNEALNTKYAKPYIGANGLVLGIICKGRKK